MATALNEIAIAAQLDIALDEPHIPVCDAVQGACEILGLDPLYVANEGRFIAIVPAHQADDALNILRATCPTSPGFSAQQIGRVKQPANPDNFGLSQGRVTLNHAIGGSRILDYISGEQLPRIC
ncbi:MAG TPA: AIR synthase-related protein [Chroococcidiopsis sp.]